jgi:hypothetical protein
MTDATPPTTGSAVPPPDTAAAAGNGRSNNRRNYTRSNNSNSNSNSNDRNRGTKFAGTIENIETLSTKAERKGKENFASFNKSLHQHVITTFKNPQDIAVAVTEFEDPMKKLNNLVPTLAKVMEDLGYELENSISGESQDETTAREDRNADKKEIANDLKKAEIRIFAERRKMVKGNLTSLWGVILGQCTPSLKEEVRAMEGYEDRAAAYDSIWFLQTLQKVTAGVTNTSNSYYSLFHSLKDLYMIRQKEHESVDDYFRRFESAIELVRRTRGRRAQRKSHEQRRDRTTEISRDGIRRMRR